eukprot:TRINITY_DN3308_c0_g4_i1.p1 TRINITY_DN3308_c0_g4~~TRINITY_DN3308_c0_g4_i1.p1  ORF type:complete len:260 (+),score=67.76 TRINITY_DN3308_c0_g4_i1:265-1044(+)
MEKQVREVESKHKEVLKEVKKILEQCPEGGCKEFREKMEAYFKKYAEDQKSTVEAEKKQAEEYIKKFLEVMKQKFSEIEQLRKQAAELAKKIADIRKKMAAPARILQTTSSLTTELEKLAKAKNDIATKLNEFKTWVKEWYTKYGKYVDARTNGLVRSYFARMTHFKAAVIKADEDSRKTQNIVYPVIKKRVLASTSASTGVTVSTDEKSDTSVGMPKSEDNPPTVNTAAPTEQKTQENNSFAQFYKLAAILALAIFFY